MSINAQCKMLLTTISDLLVQTFANSSYWGPDGPRIKRFSDNYASRTAPKRGRGGGVAVGVASGGDIPRIGRGGTIR